MAVLMDYYNTGDNSGPNCFGTTWQAQTFTPQVEYTIYTVKLLIYKNDGGSPKTVTVSIRNTDENGKPTGGDLTSGTTDGDTLPIGSPYEWREITFSTPISLTESIKYAIVARAISGDVSNLIKWRNDSSGDYSLGERCQSTNSGSTWSLMGDDDFMFETYGLADQFDEGVKSVSATASVSLAFEQEHIVEGTKSVSATATPLLAIDIFSGVWPEEKPEIDPEKEWSESSGAWVTVGNRGGGRYRSFLLAVGQYDAYAGAIYYGEK